MEFSFGSHAVLLPDTSIASFVPKQKVLKKYRAEPWIEARTRFTLPIFFALLVKQLSVLLFFAMLAGKSINRNMQESIIFFLEEILFGTELAGIAYIFIHCED